MSDPEIEQLRAQLPWGTVDRLPSGNIRLRGWVDGKEQNVGTFDNAAEALWSAQETLRTLEGRAVGLTLGAWGERWLDQRELAGRHKSIGDTRRVWQRYILDDPIADQLLRKVRAKHVAQWLHRLQLRRATRPTGGGSRTSMARQSTARPLSDSTLRNALSALSASMTDAVMTGHIAANPCTGVKIARMRSLDEPVIYLTRDEIVRVLTHAKLPERQKTIFTVAIFAGLRQGELWGLHWQDVDLNRERLTVRYGSSRKTTTKGKARREVQLLPPARRALARWRSRGGVERAVGYVFHGIREPYAPHGKGYDAQWAASWRRRCLIRDEVTFQAFRHTCGVHLVSGTWGRPWRLIEVQHHLGHKSVETTEKHYARFLPEGLERAAREAREQWEEQGIW